MEPKLKTQIIVQSIIRQCDVRMIPAIVLHKGDVDSGALIMKINLMNKTCFLIRKSTMPSGKSAWIKPLSDNPIPEDRVDEYIEREINRDRDLWVIEIEDAKSQYEPVEPII